MSVFQLDAVECEEGQRRVRRYAFVAVHEGVVLHQAVSEPGRLLPERLVQFFRTEGGERGGDGGFKKTLVAQPGLPAGFGYKIAVQRYDLALA